MVVSLGTDHHKFDRLVGWVDEWLGSRDEKPACVVQHGASRPPENARGITRMPRQQLLSLYAQATVVIVQGGPGSILDAREVGHLPIAVPRLPELNEVVDGHQVAFSRTMAEHGNALLAEDFETFIERTEAALRNPGSVRTPPRNSDATAAAYRLGLAVDRLEKDPTGPIAVRRIRQLLLNR